ncbi:hypothetical protein [Ferrimicrobium sp.]|uniref:hypothetical protein n=1 Tax=Ferrimicrobium sp. TaxID=2926050 RepID=UPI00260C9623|nr:hypothetical protein [Ferrimicrobium sp.]
MIGLAVVLYGLSFSAPSQSAWSQSARGQSGAWRQSRYQRRWQAYWRWCRNALETGDERSLPMLLSERDFNKTGGYFCVIEVLVR